MRASWQLRQMSKLGGKSVERLIEMHARHYLLWLSCVCFREMFDGVFELTTPYELLIVQNILATSP